MPSRKKTNLSRYSRNAKRKRLSRSQETAEDREARLAAGRERQAISRASESCTQRESRLSKQRYRSAISRSYETSQEHEARLSVDRKRRALMRESDETFTDREARWNSRRSRTPASWTSPPETDNERVRVLEQRLLALSQLMKNALTKAKQSFDHSNCRKN